MVSDGATTIDRSRGMSAREIEDVYADHAGWLRRVEPLERLVLGRARRRQFGGVDGSVLDVACGTGPNFRYLGSDAHVIGIDLSPDMLPYARRRLERSSLDGTVARMDAETLAFPDDRFDAVISSLSTCTIPDPVRAIREMVRVARPDGRVALLEHGRSTIGPVAALQDRVANRHYRHFACDLTQDPVTHVLDAGVAVEARRDGPFGILTALDVRPVAGAPPAPESSGMRAATDTYRSLPTNE